MISVFTKFRKHSPSQFFIGLTLLAQIPLCAQKFTDVTKAAGIDHQFVVYEGMFGGGACVFDINNDGWEDVFITSGMNEDVLYLEDVPENTSFKINQSRSGQIFRKGHRIRRRFHCLETNTNRVYFVSPLAEVLIVKD